MRYSLPLLLLTACTGYTPPEASGLPALGAFPGPGDVCQKLGENELTAPFLDDSQQLIGCPINEPGAIADRVAEGGVLLEQIGKWQLIGVPLR